MVPESPFSVNMQGVQTDGYMPLWMVKDGKGRIIAMCVTELDAILICDMLRWISDITAKHG